MRDRPGRPPKDTKNTEHILVSREVKEGLEFLRYAFKYESYGEVVLKLFQQYIFTFRCTHFLQELAILNKNENETDIDSLNRMVKYKPRKIELSTLPIWPDGQDLDMRTLEEFISSGRYK
jgi:hypothetical protein